MTHTAGHVGGELFFAHRASFLSQERRPNATQSARFHDDAAEHTAFASRRQFDGARQTEGLLRVSEPNVSWSTHEAPTGAHARTAIRAGHVMRCSRNAFLHRGHGFCRTAATASPPLRFGRTSYAASRSACAASAERFRRAGKAVIAAGFANERTRFCRPGGARGFGSPKCGSAVCWRAVHRS